MKVMVIIFFLAAISFSKQDGSTEINNAQDFINQFDDRGAFIRYYLRIALKKQKTYKYRSFGSLFEDEEFEFEEIEAPEYFEDDLLDWVQNEFQIPAPLVASLLISDVICIPRTNECYSVNDIGALCCPF